MQLSRTCNTIISCTNESSLFVLVTARSLTRSCFWTPTALLEVEDILNILLVKLICFDYESLYEIFWPLMKIFILREIACFPIDSHIY